MKLRISPGLFLIWVSSLLFTIVCGFIFVSWAESKLTVAGGIQDVEHWANLTEEAKVAGDLTALSGYLHHRVAEMMVVPNRNNDALMVFAFMDRVAKSADPLRKIADLQYALNVCRKRQLLFLSPILKMYYWVRTRLIQHEKNSGFGGGSISDSSPQVEALRSIQKIESANDWDAARANYEKLLAQPELARLQSELMLKLAYFLYEKEPVLAREWVEKVIKKRPRSEVRQAAVYLKNKLSQKPSSVESGAHPVSRKIESFFKRGLFEKATDLLSRQEESTLTARMKEIRSWLGSGEKESSQEKQTLFSAYFSALWVCFWDPHASADFFVRLAAEDGAGSLGPLLRYQAWGLEYFDVKDYKQAAVISEMLKMIDPLSLYGKEVAVKGWFRRSNKIFIGAELEEIFAAEPYRLERNRKNVWSELKRAQGRTSEVLVHEGHVYVVDYGLDGNAKKLKKVAGGESGAENESIGNTLKLNVIEKFFYQRMKEYFPFLARAFKKDILMRIEKQKTEKTTSAVSSHVYTETDFQVGVIDTVQALSGKLFKNVRGQIGVQGFKIDGLLQVLFITEPVLMEFKVTNAGDGGELVMTLTSVGVGNFKIPRNILKALEMGFNKVVNEGESLPVDIFDIDYQSGSVAIKCRMKTK